MGGKPRLKRFWLSWYEPVDDSGDYRPDLEYPTRPEVQRYWCSGMHFEDIAGFGHSTFATLCAVVDATSEAKAWEAIDASWSGRNNQVRFSEERALDWRPHGGRFPWPEERQCPVT